MGIAERLARITAGRNVDFGARPSKEQQWRMDRTHEAIGTDDSSEYESGKVSATLQKGYRSGERILRPALVRVAS